MGEEAQGSQGLGIECECVSAVCVYGVCDECVVIAGGCIKIVG